MSGTDHSPLGLTHFDAAGDAHMVDVSDKPATARRRSRPAM